MPYHMTHLSIFDMPSHYVRHFSISSHTLELMPSQLSLHFSTTWEPYTPFNTLALPSCHDLIDILTFFATRESNYSLEKQCYTQPKVSLSLKFLFPHLFIPILFCPITPILNLS
jgi:hypothetical protein